MIDRLGQLLHQHERLYGVICRDATLTEIELMAQAGYHLVFLDLEHGAQPIDEVIRLGRTIAHLGMVSVVRIPELSRAHVQVLLDGGIEVIVLPDLGGKAAQANELVQLGKYPPLGRRGLSSTVASTGFTMGADQKKALRAANDATHLLVMVESDETYDALDAILDVEGIDAVTVGPNDWGASLGLFGDEARAYLAPKIDRVVSSASKAGKTVSVSVASPAEASHYFGLGARLFFIGGVDVARKRKALTDPIAPFQDMEKVKA